MSGAAHHGNAMDLLAHGTFTLRRALDRLTRRRSAEQSPLVSPASPAGEADSSDDEAVAGDREFAGAERR